ncbi:MAG: nucleotidyltransferase family protein [Pseudomonadota bacterium]
MPIFHSSTTSAIVLAAGEGRRLGGVSKALLRLDGTPLIVRLIKAMHELQITDICVVTGAHHDRICAVIEPLGARAVFNPAFASGQSSSVRLGLEATDAASEAIMVLLCDQPLLGSADLTELLQAFRSRSYGEFCVPQVNGQRGNPVVLSQDARLAILQMPAPTACREYMDRHPASISWHESANDHYVFDIDTPDDVKAAEARTKQSVEIGILDAREPDC